MTPTPQYRVLDAGTLPAYLDSLADVRRRLGARPADWHVREVGDGNLNLVFLVEGPEGAVCVKQALPYVRVAGPSWPMTPERAAFEHAYFRSVGPHVAGRIPLIHHYDPQLFCLVMERLSPHIILRNGLIAGQRYPRLATHMGEYVARASFLTSDLAQPFERKFEALALFARNTPLIRISVDLIFADPYRVAPRNRHTCPELDTAVQDLRADETARLAAMRMGWKFLNQPEALVHGDLHSGSVMVTATDTRVIDPEFAFYGPIGFDLGAFLGNLLLSWYSQPGHADGADDRRAHQEWILEQAGEFWMSFQREFLALWSTQAGGDAFPSSLCERTGVAGIMQTRRAYLDALYNDMLGFAACKMIRRIVGFAHVADLESITDRPLRARCEASALGMARRMLAEPGRFGTIQSLLEAVAATATPPRSA
jgi:5-methylthioribose kinase